MLEGILIIGVYERYHFGPGLTGIENTEDRGGLSVSPSAIQK